MTTRSSDLIWISGLTVAGLTMGWLFRSRATVVNLPPSINSSPNSAQKHELRPATTKSKTKWQTFATQFSKISRPDREVFKENIAPQDRKVVIEALLMQGGPDGFDVHMELMIDQILSAWGGENFEEAWAWSQQIQGDGTRNFIAGKLIGLMVKTDPVRALAAYLEFEQMNPSFKSEVPEKLFASAALKNTEEFLNCTESFRFSWDTGKPCEFAKDFNFQQVADGLAKLPKKEAGKIPSGFPRNFYEVWAERDRDREAAFKSLTGGELARVGKFDEFLEGLERHNPPEAVWDCVAKKIQESEVSSKAIRTNLANLQAVSFNGIIQALPDAASRDQFLMQIVLECGVTHQFNEIPSIAISAMSSPQVRLEAFAKMHQLRMGRQWDQLNIATITDADLQAWGATRQQIADIFSAPEEKPPESD